MRNVAVDVSAYTLIQRFAPHEALGRIFGVLEGGSVASAGLGVGLGGVVVDAVGARTMLVALGLVLIGLAVTARASLNRLDGAPAHALPITGALEA
jgi:hypothetical protein